MTAGLVQIIENLLEHTWRKLRFEHVHGDDIDDEYPDGTVQQLALRLDESYSAEALTLQATSVRVGSP